MNTYIVIGAFDLISHDNLYYNLIQENDFRAIFIEPIPIYYIELIKNCSKLKGKCYFENTAISDDFELVEIDYVNPMYLHIYPNYITGCSSVKKDGKPINRYLNDVDSEHRLTINIQAVPFKYIIDKYNIDKVYYLQIDTEGYDEKIVKSIDLNKYDVKKLKFEHHYISDTFCNELRELYPNYNIEILDSDIILEK